MEKEDKIEEKVDSKENNNAVNNDKMILIFICSVLFVLLVGAAIAVYFVGINDASENENEIVEKVDSSK